MKILFLNHVKSQCGVYWYGYRLWKIWKGSNMIDFDYKEIKDLENYNLLIFSKYDAIIYNYHPSTMPWLSSYTIQKKIPNIGIWHEILQDKMFDYTLDIPSEIPRPIFEEIPKTITSTDKDVIDFIHYKKEGVPIIGSFGFGFQSKGFDRIITNTCNQFDKAIIKIIMPMAQYGDSDGQITKQIRNQCTSKLTNPNVELRIIHQFISDDDLLYFLSTNTINVFLYAQENNRGISSVIDFALSVDRPICISDSYMFRHIYDDHISITKHTIKECIQQDRTYLSSYREKWSHRNNIFMIENYLKQRILSKTHFVIRGIFYNSTQERSIEIHKLGLELYHALNTSIFFHLDYTEDIGFKNDYDFCIMNYHIKSNNWIRKHMIDSFKGQTYCIISKILDDNLLELSPKYFNHYLLLDSTEKQVEYIHILPHPPYDISQSSHIQTQFEKLLLH
jgi:hypothetical protein